MSLAYHEPAIGDPLFDEYLSIQGSNSYIEYRLETLRRVLEAVVAHPSQLWVRGRLALLMSGALSLVTSYFDEGVALARVDLAAVER